MTITSDTREIEKLRSRHGACNLGDSDLLRQLVECLLPLSDDERRQELDGHDIGPWNEYVIKLSLEAGMLTYPPTGWQPTHDTKGILVKLRRGDKP